MTTAYSEFFKVATGHAPYPYQEYLAERCPAVLNIPTGLGKTEATALAWLYRRVKSPEETPRRLVYCLPMRSLVEQTRDRLQACFGRLASSGAGVPEIETVMGGDVGERWFRCPEQPFVIVGTQDMLLSRALNRGYGMSRFQWAMTFGAANDDAYWVVDEVQLQGVGAVTAAQLQAFRERFGTFHKTETTLASATLDEDWFETADFSLGTRPKVSLGSADEANPNVSRVLRAAKRIESAAAASEKELASFARERHRPGTLTMVVVNRVGRAQETYRHLKRTSSDMELVLLHSRYRPGDRASHAQQLLREIDPAGPGRIVVATQVVEAGIDVSAATLITDVAPWPSLVQRFGRCNRRGSDTDARCIWIDSGDIKKGNAAPYELEDLWEARQLLEDLGGASAAPADLPKRPIPLRGGLVIRKPEFFDLFDTSPDFSGHDVDVSPYIREADEMSVSLFWRDEPPTGANEAPQADELCAAPVSRVKELVKELRVAGRRSDARIGNRFASGSDAAWTDAHESEIPPGTTLWLRSHVGWYDVELGFERSGSHVEPVSVPAIRDFSESCPAVDSDALSVEPRPVTLTDHAQDTLRHARALTSAVGLPEKDARIVEAAALWHDAGKAHEVFQDTMRRANGTPAADKTIWAKAIHRVHHKRRGFRHELPGALLYLKIHDGLPDSDTIAFLVAAHHGKFRMAAHQWPFEAPVKPFQLMGVREGDALPVIDLGGGITAAPTALSLDTFKVGQTDGKAWVERTAALRDNASLGPFRLAYMELLVRIADWRASEEEAK